MFRAIGRINYEKFGVIVGVVILYFTPMMEQLLC